MDTPPIGLRRSLSAQVESKAFFRSGLLLSPPNSSIGLTPRCAVENLKNGVGQYARGQVSCFADGGFWVKLINKVARKLVLSFETAIARDYWKGLDHH